MQMTPSILAITPNVRPIVVPAYDFNRQTRWNGEIMAMAYTVNSIQTFDNSGRPKDAKSDSND